MSTVERDANQHLAELLKTLRAALPGSAVAGAASVLAIATIVVSLDRQPLDLAVGLAGLLMAVPLAVAAMVTAGPIRTIAVIVAFVLAAVPLTLLLRRGEPAPALAVALLLVVAAVGARRAVRASVPRPTRVRIPGIRVGPSTHPVLLANPRSGGRKAERLALDDEARRRGVEYVAIGPGDDLQRRAEEAVHVGADVLGMAGGDGSQGLVAQVALAHDLGFVCVPVGTRNHFAKDLGLDPDDPIGALDAFGDAEEVRIDLGLVADRVFVNNVSLGVYAMIVRAEGYREDKPRTAWRVLPTVLGPEARPLGLRFTGPDGHEHGGFQLVHVSNGPYRFTADSRFGSRERMDLGLLGIVAAMAGEGDDFLAFGTAWWAGPRDTSDAWLEWEAPEFEIRSTGPIAAGVDGEVLLFDPPLRLRSLPGALRVRVPAVGSTAT
jgi:diacylglycerol kinase family enzyme